MARFTSVMPWLTTGSRKTTKILIILVFLTGSRAQATFEKEEKSDIITKGESRRRYQSEGVARQWIGSPMWCATDRGLKVWGRSPGDSVMVYRRELTFHSNKKLLFWC
ncbi:hypothetical protein REIS_2019 [Rickettsia endosymbiont of Ixodes scapularis]|nr:hypothetical protein REIS_2019 [Rickettsia endosymbiont of Ixodes scapularis]